MQGVGRIYLPDAYCYIHRLTQIGCHQMDAMTLKTAMIQGI